VHKGARSGRGIACPVKVKTKQSRCVMAAEQNSGQQAAAGSIAEIRAPTQKAQMVPRSGCKAERLSH
jgi:hypothetical protein